MLYEVERQRRECGASRPLPPVMQAELLDSLLARERRAREVDVVDGGEWGAVGGVGGVGEVGDGVW